MVPLLVRTIRVEGVFIDATKDVTYSKIPYTSIRTFKASLFKICGTCFLKSIAMAFEDEIVIYKAESQSRSFWENDIEEERIPFFRNLKFEDVFEQRDTLPSKMVVQTDDIRLIRELISRGKELSWYAENLCFSGNFPGLFNFKHLFLKPFVEPGYLLLPDGVPRKIIVRKNLLNLEKPFDSKKEILFNLDIKDFKLPMEFRGLLGYQPVKLLDYVNRYYFSKSSAVKKTRKLQQLSMSFSNRIIFINVLSVTYMVWRLSNSATTAIKKIAKKE